MLAVLAFFGPPIVSEQQNRQHSLDAARVAIRYADKASRPGKPVRVAPMQEAGISSWSIKNLNIAVAYLNDTYDCQQHKRVSDFSVFERYPGVPVHPPDTTHRPQGHVSGLQGDTVEEWMSCPDVQNAALERAKVYLSNAKIGLGMTGGKRQQPQLVSRFELGLGPADELRQWDLPVRFSNISGL